MEKLLDDFNEFSDLRLEKPFIELEKTSKYNNKVEQYDVSYNLLKSKLNEEDFSLVKELVSQKESVEYLYIEKAYQIGFSDGFRFEKGTK